MRGKDWVGKLMPTFFLGAVLSVGGGALSAIAWQSGNHGFVLDLLGNFFAISLIVCVLGFISMFMYDVWGNDE